MATAVPPDDAAILAGLRLAIAGPLPLQGEPGAALYPKGAPGKKLAQAAIAKGWLTARKANVTVAGKRKSVEVGDLTEAGRRRVLQADDPRPVLEALLPVVEALAVPASPPGPADFSREVEKATAVCERAIRKAFDKLQQAVEGALGRLGQDLAAALPTAGPSPDERLVLAALQAVLARVGLPSGATGTRTVEQAASPRAWIYLVIRRPQGRTSPASNTHEKSGSRRLQYLSRLQRRTTVELGPGSASRRSTAATSRSAGGAAG